MEFLGNNKVRERERETMSLGNARPEDVYTIFNLTKHLKHIINMWFSVMNI